MKIIVIEDDIIQNNNLSKIIIEKCKNVEVLQAHTEKEAIEIIKENSIDLFFIDIKLPDGSGIELAEKIRKIRKYELTGIVFVTNQVFSVIDAFKNTHCYDFLIKPYKKEDITNILDIFSTNRQKESDEEYSIVPIDNKVMFKLYHKDIIYVEYMCRKCIIHTVNQDITSKCMTLRNFKEEVKSEYIMQTHKSFIVNINYIGRIEKQYSKLWTIYFNNSDGIAELSLKYKDELIEKLGDLSAYE